jgi:bifunctional UDP-N-acetylglucosamine pyrophosphorylase/glucosamine-1-phosphate N-acetyltransferase
MQQPLNIVILAAGKGTRMNSELAKVLHPLAGRPLLQHVLAAARALGPAKICVVYGHGGEAVKAVLEGADDVVMVQQEPQLGTGHALQQTLPHLDPDGATLVLYGDVPLIHADTLAPLVDAARRGGVALLTMALADPRGYGRIVRENGRVTRIVEEKDASEAERALTEINTGILAVSNAHLARWLPALKNDNAQGEYYLTDIIGMAAADGIEIATSHPRHHWEVLGVNSKSQLAHLERLYQHEIADRLLQQGVTLLDPKRIDVRGELTCGRDVVIDVNCVFEGRVQLGDNVVVGANCILREVSVAAGTHIAPFSLIEEAEVGGSGRIGPFARIRPGTRLAEKVHIGNFVEIKNSQVGRGAKINHLSYVGDSTVGQNVNIGAGTITCNYDGAHKYRTVIEDDVFVGSDTQLVAPVTIGRGATIGAGSTITRDVPPGELTLSRAKQITVNGWQRPVKKKD